MDYWELRRLLRDLGRVDDRWWRHEAWWNPDPTDGRTIVDDSDAGLWCTLERFVDLVVRHPVVAA